MQIQRRTDLALEARELWNEQASKKTELSGVEARDYYRGDCKVTYVKILDEQGVQALQKPVGSYITVEVEALSRHEHNSFYGAVTAVSEELCELIKVAPRGNALIVGLGNRRITPDAVGPLAIESVMVTRHLVDRIPDIFGNMRSVAALSPGVLGTTGMESAEIIRGVVQKTNPALVIMIDALASRKLSRLCKTIQLSDTGIVPGSGVGNTRAALNNETLGVPVISIGVPTVVDAATVVADLADEAGMGDIDPEIFRRYSGDLIVTPKEIDTHVEDISRVIGYAVNLALHPDLTLEDVSGFLA